MDGRNLRPAASGRSSFVRLRLTTEDEVGSQIFLNTNGLIFSGFLSEENGVKTKRKLRSASVPLRGTMADEGRKEKIKHRLRLLWLPNSLTKESKATAIMLDFFPAGRQV